jgi:TetR/AcrR family transcriptional regulator
VAERPKPRARGSDAAGTVADTLEAVMAIVRPVVECNRTQIDIGRTYLKEMVFGDPEEPHHREALGRSAQTEEAIADVLRSDERIRPENAPILAHVISAVMFLGMAATKTVEEIVQDLRAQIRVLF